MSKFEIADEAIPALLDGLLRDLDAIGVPKIADERVFYMLRHYLRDMLLDFPHDVLTCVADPAGGAAITLRIGISDLFKRDFAATAKKYAGCH